jgi:hypothetical protein
MSILEKYVEKIAIKMAEKEELRLMSFIAKNGIIKNFFGRWLFIWCDMKDYQANQSNKEEEDE